jgi:hypothetical protein
MVESSSADSSRSLLNADLLAGSYSHAFIQQELALATMILKAIKRDMLVVLVMPSFRRCRTSLYRSKIS